MLAPPPSKRKAGLGGCSTDFPADFSFADWQVACPQMLVEFVDEDQYEVGWDEYEGTVSYYIRQKSVTR